jgi:hypothetical protein
MWKLTVETHPEKSLLAYVLGYLKDHDVAGATDADALVATVSKVIVDVYADARRTIPRKRG